MNEHHRNPCYLKDHDFSHNITAIGPDFPSKEVVSDANVILFAIPTQNLRYSPARTLLFCKPFRILIEDNSQVLKRLHPLLDLARLPLLIFVNKGIETDTQALTLEIIADECGNEVAKVSVFLVSVFA